MKNAIRNRRVRESIERFRCGFLQSDREKLFNVLPVRDLARAVEEEVGAWRNRLYSPLVTLRLFVEPALHIRHHVEHGLAFHARHFVFLKFADFGATPDSHV